jgi:membrane associated rhomboid family serine protease
MASSEGIGLLLVILTIVTSYRAFSNESLMNRYLFAVDGIRKHREYYRLVSAGFVHADWWHLGFNMYALYSFAGSVERATGPIQLLLLYMASLVGGNLLALFIHRNDDGYRALGASGAVSGLIFAMIALYPGVSIRPLFMPFSMPAWLFGLAYSLYSIYGIKATKDNIGHDAHLGGGVVGVLTICAIEPAVLTYNWPIVLLLTLPTLVFLLVIARRPDWLYVRGFSLSTREKETVDERFNGHKFRHQQEVDRILDKISAKGYDSLTKEERKKLSE